VLVEREINTREIVFSSGNGPARNLSWLDQSLLAALSGDGKIMLFSEEGEGGGPKGSVYLRGADGTPATRLGDGLASDLSPDGAWALTIAGEGPQARLVLLPTAAGQPRTLSTGNLQVAGAAFLPPDGKRIVLGANEPGHGPRFYALDLAGGPPRPLTVDIAGNGAAFSPDGTLIAARSHDGQARIYPVGPGEPRPIPGLEPGEEPIQWSADGSALFVARFGELPLPIYRLTLATGKKELWKQLAPADRAGIIRIETVALTRDGMTCAYSYNRVTASDLYLVTGWK
jgi:WD40 repeat protein